MNIEKSTSESDSKHSDNKHYKLSDTADLYIGSCTNIKMSEKVNMIYFDPPFNSARNYKLSYNNSLGFSDKWTDETYETFITNIIDTLYDLLVKDGTLFFHISSACMFIPEKILRNKFKYVVPIFWKKCRSKK